MRINLPLETYRGVDGTSLSNTRCQQITLVYEMLEDMGLITVSYRTIQEEAKRRHLFGEANAMSLVRTIFPLLKKLHFVDYDDSFNAIECFTELGKQFVLACRALQNVSNETPNASQIVATLENVKSACIKEGLILMNQDPEYKNHNIWFALKLFKELGNVHWNYFLYALYMKGTGHNNDEIISAINAQSDAICEMEFLNEKNEPLPNTCFAYIRSLLLEADIIDKYDNNYYCFTVDGVSFMNHINI